MMKWLIVNADDMGADEARNAGIIQAVEAGVVTSASLLPNGPALEHALGKIRSLHCDGISFGIHVNLSEGKPLTKGLRIIAGPDGNFLGKSSAQRLLLGRGNPELEKEIREEIFAQMRRIQDAGIPIDHIDGHQHVHVFPAVLSFVAEAAKVGGIQWMRVPEEPSGSCPTGAAAASVQDEARFFSDCARAAWPVVSAAGIRVTDHFRGLRMKGQLPASGWAEFLDSLPPGITELMVHPGFAAAGAGSNPFCRFSTKDRERELEALTDGRFQSALGKSGVILTRFPETRQGSGNSVRQPDAP